MAYTTIDKSTSHHNALLYAGNGASPRSLTGVGFQPDFLWIKNRDGGSAYEHRLMDAVRGSNKVIHSSQNAAENTEEYYTVGSFDSDGWTGRNGTGSNQSVVGGNDNGVNFIAWNWKANGAGSSNSDGSITSTVSANTTAGFSISTYTGNNTAGATVGHGLGKTPKFVMIKRRDTTGSFITKADSSTDGYFYLHTNDGISSSSGWLPTSSTTFTLANQWTAYNASGGTYVAYCFAEIPGYSKIGRYVGNGNTDGTFIYTGFKPSFVLTKTTGTDNWRIIDNRRKGYNPNNDILQPSVSQNDSEQTWHDILSTGFKLRTTDSGDNADGTEYIYMAFGQTIVGTNNVPATAR